MATSINGYTFSASTNNEGNFITLVAHKDDDEGRKTEVFKFSTAEANNLCDLIRNNCKTAKDRRKAVKKGEREEEKCHDKAGSTGATPATSSTTSSSPSKSAGSSASTPPKKEESSRKKSGTGVTPAGSRQMVTGDTPKKPEKPYVGPTYDGVPPGFPAGVTHTFPAAKHPIATIRKPWAIDEAGIRTICHTGDRWACRFSADDNPTDSLSELLQAVVTVLNDPVPITEKGRYSIDDQTTFVDTTDHNMYHLHYGKEHPEFPSMYVLVGMLNTYVEQHQGCDV